MDGSRSDHGKSRGVWSSAFRRSWLYLIPIILLGCVTLPHLNQGDFRTDTARYAAVGLQAWRDGLFWFPHLHPDIPYFNKPPLVFWIHGLFLHLFGVHLWIARIPSILAAAGCVLLLVGIVRRFHGRVVALSAGCILALTYEFFRRTREISLDLWQLLFLLAALGIVAAAFVRGKGVRMLWAGVPVGAALMCKPLVALVFLPIVAVWLLWTQRGRWLGWLAGAAFVAGLVAAPWHVAMVRRYGHAFLDQYFGVEVMQRAQGQIASVSWDYYLREIGTSYWPWMILLAFGLIVAWRQLSPGRTMICQAPGRATIHRARSTALHYEREQAGLKLALIWLVSWLVALMVFPDKRPRYELPLYPAMAWIAGAGLPRLPWRSLRAWLRRRCQGLVPMAATAALLVAIVPIRIHEPPEPEWAQLFAWIRAQALRPNQVWEGALSSNDSARFYLALGWWPVPEQKRGRRKMPSGTVRVYLRDLPPAPRRGEVTVFAAGRLNVTCRVSPLPSG